MLVNGTSIDMERALAEVTYFHVELDRYDMRLASETTPIVRPPNG